MASCDKGKTRYPVPACSPDSPHCTEEVIRRSRFLAQTAQITTREEAMNFVAKIRSLHPEATHNCWAYAAGPPGDTAAVGCSDDGEPKGTAGRPMLQILLHSGVGQICTVVSRWFGGVKLGTGGLVRAYQNAVAQNIDTLPTNEAISITRWQVVTDYASLNSILHTLEVVGVDVQDQSFEANATLILAVPEDKCSVLAELIDNASNGSARLSILS